MEKYDPATIEPKWQKRWETDKLYQTPSKSNKRKFYVLDMFPYPSAEGLHVGHFKGYTATDVISRYLRMKGYNVLHPMGWDAFGLPAENYAIKTGVQPAISTKKNIEKIKQQMLKAGFSYDWSREINTTDPEYYRWTQWIFLKMFEAGLAYESEAPINFCPQCLTGLANEEVVAGVCERCGTKVVKKEIRQWILKITAYAERLLKDLEGLDWPESIIEMQKNWIGKSEGALIKFQVPGSKLSVEVFTTRPDTLFGATYMVLASEHKIIWQLKPQIANWSDVKKYIETAKQKSDLERQESKEKTGVELKGIGVVNPVNGKRIPIWVADYVLVWHGSGAIMAVPAHDNRDFEFAKKYKLPIIEVIEPNLKLKTQNLKLKESYEGEGVLVNSGQFNGLNSEIAKSKITKFLEKKKLGKAAVVYKLRDWIFSRQRYWGEPIPILHCRTCGLVPLREKDLPLTLPKVKKYQPTGTGESPLAAISEWVNTTCWKCGGPAKRETNTMPQWAGSCWYYLRFIDPENDKKLVDPNLEKYWLGPRSLGGVDMTPLRSSSYGGVDWYVGGAEHAVLHLLYARFWHKFLFDIGVVTTAEPFTKLRNVGLVLGPNGAKMSKSRGNVVTPDEIIEKYGADTLRLYEGFMGPFDQIISWDPKSLEGVWRFLNKIWNLVEEVSNNRPHLAKSDLASRGKQKTNRELEVGINRLIKKVEEDIRAMKFNTAVASMMEFINLANKNEDVVDSNIMKWFILLIGPFAPHLAEDLWQKLGGRYSVHWQSWPKFAKELTKFVKKTIVVQVNGRLRDKFVISQSIAKTELEKKALSLPKIQKYVNGKQIKNIIIIPNRIINIVTG